MMQCAAVWAVWEAGSDARPSQPNPPYKQNSNTPQVFYRGCAAVWAVGRGGSGRACAPPRPATQHKTQHTTHILCDVRTVCLGPPKALPQWMSH